MKTLKVLAVLLLAVAQCAAAPAYSVGNSVPCGTGMVVTVWNAETPTPGNGTTAASQQVLLQNAGVSKPGTPFSVDGKFSGAPGAFEVDVQVAAADADTNYQTCSNCNITTVDATNNTWHLDYSGNARFV